MKNIRLIMMLCLCAVGNNCMAQKSKSLDVAYVHTSEDEWQLIDRANKIVADSLFEHDSLAVFNCNEGMAITEKAGKYGFRNLFGESVIANSFDTVTAFKNGQAAVRTSTGWHLLSRNGSLDTKVLATEGLKFYLQSDAEPAHCKDGYCFIETDSTINCKGPDGKLLLGKPDIFIAPWNDVNSFIADRILKYKIMANKVCSCQKLTSYYGFVDRKGKWVIEPDFEQADIFSFELASVSSGTEEIFTYGYINEAGEWVIQPVYKEAGRFMRVKDN